MADELDDARGARRAFLQAVSHELRTPLTAIRGWSAALTDGTVHDDAARIRATDVITAEAARLERLVQDLLDLARLDNHEFALRPDATDCAATVTGAVDALRRRAAEVGITITVDGVEAPIAAHLDAERLAQIVVNLLDNAIGHARTRVTVVVHHDQTTISVEVVDDGPGIADDDREAVFDRLWTRRAVADRSRGTGLGLTITRALARAMGGDARLTSTGPDGTCFTVEVQRSST